MDYLDYYDCNIPKYKKCDRVRSWYLYEQFKSLESNQLDATRKLKDRCYQDRILRRELSERKARRILYDQVGPSHSESQIERVQSVSTRTSLNTDDFFENFHELQDDEGLAKFTSPDLLEACSQDNPQQLYEDDFKNAEPISDYSCAESVISVISAESSETVTENLKEYLETEKQAKLEEVEMDFDEINTKMKSFERLTQLKSFDNLSDNEDSRYSVEGKEMKQTIIQKNENKEIKHTIRKGKTANTPDNNIYLMWTKLVTFAYQIMDSNHGNLYHDYGSQLLTAVLACDVLRRGINRMCHILQPYVCPIKFTADSVSSIGSYKICKRKKPQRPKKSSTRRYKRYKPNNSIRKTRPKSRPENWDQHSLPLFVENKNGIKYLQTSVPWRSIPILSVNKGNPFKFSNNSRWPFLLSDNSVGNGLYRVACTCGCHKVVNPMLRLSLYLDQILRDIDDPLLA